MFVDPAWQPVFRELGIDADAVFDHPLIKAWRTLDDRENCTLDAELIDGRQVRLHVKRYPGAAGASADAEVAGHRALAEAGIPTAPLVAWGAVRDGRSFVIFADLAGYRAADKLLEDGSVRFDDMLTPTADVAARLHRAGLHHRDLYLNHFFVKDDARGGDSFG